MRKKWWYRLVSFVLGGTGHLAALVTLTGVFWFKLKDWVYSAGTGGDFCQFIHYVVYERRHMGFPISSWNHIWHKGAPRILDTSWLHFYLIQPLIDVVGVDKSIWLYPALALLGVVLFSYFLFYEASRSRLIALGLAAVVAMSKGLHTALTYIGMGTSAISQMWLPAQLYFAARFYNRGGYKNLVLAAVMGTLGIYSHGLTMGFFGLLPTGLFILFSLKNKERFINKRTIKNAALFSMVVLSVGALGFWPGFITNAFTGGGQAAMGFATENRALAEPEILENMIEVTDPGLWWGLGIGLAIGLVVWLWQRKNKKRHQRVTPYLAVGGFIFLWWTSYYFGFNRFIELFFSWRIFWTVPVVGGMVAAALLRPLSERVKFKNLAVRLGAWLGLNGIKLAILLVVAKSVLGVMGEVSIEEWLTEWRGWEPRNVKVGTDRYFKPVFELVDVNDWNHRLWTLDWAFNQKWSVASDMPLSEGYFHFATKRSVLWEGWASGIFTGATWRNEDTTWEVNENQAKFFIDWYGINSLWVCSQGHSYCAIWKYFRQEDSPLIDKRSVVKSPAGLIVTIKDEYVSGVVEPIGGEVIGFVGSESGYRGFLLSLATLNLNTSRVVVLRLGESVRTLSDEVLADLDGVVVYDQRKESSFEGMTWERLRRFVEKGGKVWLETGGNSIMRAKDELPGLFPIEGTEYGDLGRSWQLGGDWARGIETEKLKPLVYGEDVWQMSYAQDEGVKEGAKVVLRQDGYPVGVAMDLEKGKVLWTGVNWFFRQEAHKENGLKEAQPVGLMLEKVFDGLDEQIAEAEVEFIRPEETKILGKGFKGVVYKYTKWPGWTAYAQADGEKKKLKIYTAGPELMYASVPKEMRGKEVEVRFEYKGPVFDWICLGITVIAIGIVGVYLITGRVMLPKRSRRKGKGKQKKTSITSWWDDEES